MDIKLKPGDIIFVCDVKHSMRKILMDELAKHISPSWCTYLRACEDDDLSVGTIREIQQSNYSYKKIIIQPVSSWQVSRFQIKISKLDQHSNVIFWHEDNDISIYKNGKLISNDDYGIEKYNFTFNPSKSAISIEDKLTSHEYFIYKMSGILPDKIKIKANA